MYHCGCGFPHELLVYWLHYRLHEANPQQQSLVNVSLATVDRAGSPPAMAMVVF